MSNSEIFPGEYQVYRKDCNIFGGGVFILVDSNIPSNQVMLDSETPCEAVWVQIHTCNHSSMLLGLFYCSPQSPVSVWDDLACCVSQLRQVQLSFWVVTLTVLELVGVLVT